VKATGQFKFRIFTEPRTHFHGGQDDGVGERNGWCMIIYHPTPMSMSEGTYRIYIYNKASLVITNFKGLREMNSKDSPSRKTTRNIPEFTPFVSEDRIHEE
jgi:hypothetical protein